MARIRYDQYLLSEEGLFVITNSDSESATDIIPQSLSNPPIKMKILNAKHIIKDNYEVSDFFPIYTKTTHDVKSKKDLSKLISGELPNWRLVGVNFCLDGCDLFYIKKHSSLHLSEVDHINLLCCHFEELQLEFIVDYKDDFSPQRYVAKMRQKRNTAMGFSVQLTEYYGNRKVRKIEFSEWESGSDLFDGHLCHITEY